MTEQGLDCPQIATAGQEMRCKTMAQCVRRRRFRKAERPAQPLHSACTARAPRAPRLRPERAASLAQSVRAELNVPRHRVPHGGRIGTSRDFPPFPSPPAFRPRAVRPRKKVLRRSASRPVSQAQDCRVPLYPSRLVRSVSVISARAPSTDRAFGWAVWRVGP